MTWSRLFRVRRPSVPPARASARRPALRVEPLEDRSVPAGVFTPNTFGGGDFAPFDGFGGQVFSASGDVDGDGVADIITSQGRGGGSLVTVFDGAAARFSSLATPIASFYAYSNVAGAATVPGFGGDVFVASADFNQDGFAEVVTSTGAGGFGHVKVFDFRDPVTGGFLASNPILRTSFYAYPGFLGDVRIATVNRAFGPPVLVTASGAGTTESDLRVYNNVLGIGPVTNGVFVAPAARTLVFPGYFGGVSIAPGNVTTIGSELLVSPNVGDALVSTFTIGGFGTTGGLTLTEGARFATGLTPVNDLRLATADLNGDGRVEILSAPAGAAGSPISVFGFNNGVATTLNPLTNFQGFGFFGNSFLGSSVFTAPVSAATVATPGVVTPGFTTPAAVIPGFGTTGFGTIGFGATGFGSTAVTPVQTAPVFTTPPAPTFAPSPAISSPGATIF